MSLESSRLNRLAPPPHRAPAQLMQLGTIKASRWQHGVTLAQLLQYMEDTQHTERSEETPQFESEQSGWCIARLCSLDTECRSGRRRKASSRWSEGISSRARPLPPPLAGAGLLQPGGAASKVAMRAKAHPVSCHFKVGITFSTTPTVCMCWCFYVIAWVEERAVGAPSSSVEDLLM